MSDKEKNKSVTKSESISLGRTSPKPSNSLKPTIVKTKDK